jgi:uncharacterized protein
VSRATTTQQRHPDPADPAVIDVHDFRRAGGMKRLERVAQAGDDLGNAVNRVPLGAPLDLALLLESVIEGVLVTGTASMVAVAECSRCLTPMAEAQRIDFSELFLWEPQLPEELSEDDEPLPVVADGLIDLGPLLRDTIVIELPLAPVCDDSCPGLCATCGAPLAADPGHAHEQTDERWGPLKSLDLGSADGG